MSFSETGTQWVPNKSFWNVSVVLKFYTESESSCWNADGWASTPRISSLVWGLCLSPWQKAWVELKNMHLVKVLRWGWCRWSGNHTLRSLESAEFELSKSNSLITFGHFYMVSRDWKLFPVFELSFLFSFFLFLPLRSLPSRNWNRKSDFSSHCYTKFFLCVNFFSLCELPTDKTIENIWGFPVDNEYFQICIFTVGDA